MLPRSKLRLVALSVLLVGASVPAADAAVPQEVKTVTPAAASNGSTTVSPAEQLAKITGPGSTSATDTNWSVKATDLGILWDNGRGQVFAAFGDTYGAGWTGPGGGAGDQATIDWRCQVLGRSSDQNLADGMSFDDFVVDRPGHAKELFDCPKQPGIVHTTIPTAGVTIGKRSYLHYMSVNYWGPPGRWFTNEGAIAYSDNNGQTWKISRDARWVNTPGRWDNPFQQASFVHKGDYVYMFGTPNGRGGSAHVARVRSSRVLEKSSYEYWTGTRWSKGSEWIAAPIVVPNVGELSVQYNTYLKRWIMLYIDDARGLNGQPDIVFRESLSPQGPWSGEQVVATGQQFTALYGSFIHPWSKGNQLYFSMSQWLPYNAFLMRTTLTKGSGPLSLLSEPSFEGQLNGEKAPWVTGPGSGIDFDAGGARTGKNNAWANTSEGWSDVKQQFAVKPHTKYRLTGWVRTSANNNNAYFGVRLVGGGPWKEQKFERHDAYTQLTVDFDSGPHTVFEVFAGKWANGGSTWIQVDDVNVVETGPSTTASTAPAAPRTAMR